MIVVIHARDPFQPLERLVRAHAWHLRKTRARWGHAVGNERGAARERGHTAHLFLRALCEVLSERQIDRFESPLDEEATQMDA